MTIQHKYKIGQAVFKVDEDSIKLGDMLHYRFNTIHICGLVQLAHSPVEYLDINKNIWHEKALFATKKEALAAFKKNVIEEHNKILTCIENTIV